MAQPNIPHRPKIKKVYRIQPQIPSEDIIGKTCSICGEGILNSVEIVICPECKLPYHYECWKEIGGCGNYGCPAEPEIKKEEYSPANIYSPGWTSKKKCPSCGTMIISDALVCHVCQASFPTEKPMTKTQWENRPYEESELMAVRIKVIGHFVASVIGCLAPFMTILNILPFVLDNYLFKFKRLSPELRFVQYASIVISTIWLILNVLLFLSA